MAPLSMNSISLSTFNATLARYSSIAPAKLADLDALRYVTIPAKLAERKKEEGNASLAKSEVESLVEWKLKHGTFRPKLLQLVQSNPALLIEETTRSAFAILDPTSPLPALKLVTALKGIGPATASLLLSVYDPDGVPFFSDELYRWVSWGDGGAGGGEGWKKKIKYDVKEYAVVVQKVGELMRGLGVRAQDVERVAWVLGKEGVDVGADEEGGEEEVAHAPGKRPEIEEDSKQVVKKTKTKGSKEKGEVKTASKGETKAVKKSVKRTCEAVSPPEGVRRSSRRKVDS
ncbi:hypothetical protein K504DRAFT_379441 [Pleomassaria siparia CBS 279.74]|uniref:Uncharacterized protein n=1 Tax=Pleomassaria siparia CBS 279.74 TaxID=1314801 RepID=A0A6G1KA39_9PLEO|nr:hypothetical protein K504DRAFT_379441 [Pleomassaria siparia CBS 279.74]